MAKLYVVSLSDAERLVLRRTATDTRSPTRKTVQARILLKADTGPEGPEWTDTKIAEAFEVSVPTVERLRKRAVTEGIEAALQERRHGTVAPKLDGEGEARLTALACSQPPAGRTRWSLHLLSNYFSDREGVPVSYELVRRTLKKTGSPRISRSSGASHRTISQLHAPLNDPPSEDVTEVKVVDPRHPLFGREFPVRSISAPLHGPPHVDVVYRESMTLRLPLAATTLAAPRLGIPTKLTVDAVTDFLTLAEAWEAVCPTTPTSSGTTCPPICARPSAPNFHPSSVR